MTAAAGAALDLSPSVLDIDAAAVAHGIARTMRDQVFHQLRRRGVVVGLSGGIDSSVVAAWPRGRSVPSGLSAC